MIYLKSIKKKFDDKIIINDFSAEFDSSHINFITGRSGIGKTTLLRIIMGLDNDYEGVCKVDSNISVVFQDNVLCENMSVFLNLKLTTKNLTKKIAADELNKIGLKNVLDDQVSQLSGGMKRRVCIARAILSEFDTLILDEPFKGLDIDTKEFVMDYVINNVNEKTVLIVTHDQSEIDYFKNNASIKITRL